MKSQKALFKDDGSFKYYKCHCRVQTIGSSLIYLFRIFISGSINFRLEFVPQVELDEIN